MTVEIDLTQCENEIEQLIVHYSNVVRIERVVYQPGFNPETKNGACLLHWLESEKINIGKLMLNQ